MSPSSYAGDPRWIKARYSGTCAKCHEAFGRGADVFYYPKGKKTYSGACADAASRDFAAAVADEDFMNGGY